MKVRAAKSRYRRCIGASLWPRAPLQRIQLILIVEKSPSLWLVKDGLESLGFEITIKLMERSRSLADDFHGQWQKQNLFMAYLPTVFTHIMYMSMKHVAISSVFINSLKIKLILELICHCNVKLNECAFVVAVLPCNIISHVNVILERLKIFVVGKVYTDLDSVLMRKTNKDL